MTNKITDLEQQQRHHNLKADQFESAARMLAHYRNDADHDDVRVGGHHGLGGESASVTAKIGYEAFMRSWRQLGPGLIRAAELDLMAQARVEREKARAIERQLAPIYAAVEELAGPERESDDG